jgi:hypothetical protein
MERYTPEEGDIGRERPSRRTRFLRLADEQPLESAVGIATCMRSRISYALAMRSEPVWKRRMGA